MSRSKKEIPFEEAMTALEESVAKMEDCQNILNGMKKKIEILTRESGDGQWRDMSREEAVPDENDFFALQNEEEGN